MTPAGSSDKENTVSGKQVKTLEERRLAKAQAQKKWREGTTTATGMKLSKKRTFSKALNSSMHPESDEDSDDNEAGQCGLRNISERVMQVLLEMHTTTYK